MLFQLKRGHPIQSVLNLDQKSSMWEVKVLNYRFGILLGEFDSAYFKILSFFHE